MAKSLRNLSKMADNTGMAVKTGELSALVRSTRKFAKLSQAELAELAGVGKTLVFDLENGRETISFSNLKKICRVLNIQILFESPVRSAD